MIVARTRSFVCRRCCGRTPSCPHPRGRQLSASTAPDAAPADGDGDVPSSASPVNTSLALSVHFRHPDLGMRDHEILSRATAFLLAVDPPDPDEGATAAGDGSEPRASASAFPHLARNAEVRNKLLRRQDYRHEPAGGPRRLPRQLGWLEFCPVAFRPRVHVVASSHVLAPWLWPKYYAQDWLRVVGQEHVRYSLEVWGGATGGEGTSGEGRIRHDGKLKGAFEPLAKFALNPYPIHHPENMDVAVIHLKQEEEALKHLKSLGIQPLHLPTMHDFETSSDPVFEPGERVLFQGFEVHEANATDQESFDADKSTNSGAEDDERIFHPYSSLGILTMASPDRFLARTAAGPLPEGLCGGPAIRLPREASVDKNKIDATPPTIRGVVEGIVPTTHENAQLAGMASFLPSYRVREFVDFAERAMLEQIIDEDLFKRIADMKEGRDDRGTTYAGRGGDVHKLNDEGNDAGREGRGAEDDDDELPGDVLSGIEATSADDEDTPHLDSEYQAIVASLRKRHTPEEVDAILATVEREKKEVIRIMEKEGGEVDDVIAAVRKRTYEEKDMIVAEIEKEILERGNISEGEIVPPNEGEKPP